VPLEEDDQEGEPAGRQHVGPPSGISHECQAAIWAAAVTPGAPAAEICAHPARLPMCEPVFSALPCPAALQTA
jgi:hypothetical protein